MIQFCQEAGERFTVPGEDWATEQQRYYYPPLATPLRSGVRVNRLASRTTTRVEATLAKLEKVVSRIESEIDAVVRAKVTEGVASRSQGALAALDRIAALPKGWDTYGSPPVPEAAVRQARMLIIILHLARCPDPIVSPVPGGGGVQLEWNRGDRGVEVYVDADGDASYLRTDEDKVVSLGSSPTRAGFEINKLINWVGAA